MILLIKPSLHYSGKPQLTEVFLERLRKIMSDVPFSLEMNVVNKKIFFTARIKKDFVDLLESQIYGTWPDFEIQRIEEFLPHSFDHSAIATLTLSHSDIFPLNTVFTDDHLPLSNILNFFNKVAANESLSLQYQIIPFSSETQAFKKQRTKALDKIRFSNSLKFIKRMTDEKYSTEYLEKSYSSSLEKSSHPLYQVQVQLLYTSTSFDLSKSKLQQLSRLFVTFEGKYTKPLFHIKPLTEKAWNIYRELSKETMHYLTGQEITNFFHFPRATDQIPNILKVLAKKGQPPLALPTAENTLKNDISIFGTTNFRDMREDFGITYEDRARHMYIVGKSGSGKSKLLELLILSDIMNGKGIGVIDPHGDLIDTIMAYIPENRVKDVVFFNPDDADFPISFNPLEKVDPQYRIQVAGGFIEIFKKLFGSNWNPRLEHVLRFIVLALLDTENATVLSILKMLTDRSFRQEVIPQIQDSVVKNFWTNEFSSWSEKFDSDAIMPILNKIGQFLSNTQVRNIFCQRENKFQMKNFMDEGKIVLIKLSKGLLGEENSELMGSMIITKVQQAAMQRASMNEHQRRDFYFYVDEFQNFATDTFGNILSEARKYKLSLTVSHQFMKQLTENIRSTVFGNVGTIISFRVGHEDATVLAKEFSPIFSEQDIVNLGIQEIYTKLTIHGEMKDAFSARTKTVPPPPPKNFIQEIINYSRQEYCQTRAYVEEEISGKENQTVTLIKKLQQRTFSAPLL